MRAALALTLALLGSACDDRARSDDMTGGKEHGMMLCPSAVDGARTRVSRTPRGVDLTITAEAPAAQRDVLARARAHAVMREPNPDQPEHEGWHGGPGTIGHCPVIHHGGTRVSLDEIGGGVILHVEAARPEEVEALQEQVSARVAALPASQR